ncbi:recombinase family protein [Paraburkholderia sacchari]|uniref:recombinase family protein n=1 Tax=Paraburkholderia sacchari TaxID=159450 RepID=UPI003D96B36B
MQQPFVYSYTRFSDPRQATGTSLARQTEYAERWATEHGLHLDSTLTLRDEGLSAYHSKHVQQGALGLFLRAVEDGRVPSGSVLIVEGLDRLSRAEPLRAQAQLEQIISAGISVVTASDGKVYSRERLKAQPMDLVYSLLVQIRAHEESDTKSKRVKAAIRKQCEGWLAGSHRGIIRNGKDPAWLTWTGSEWSLVPERVEAVRLVIQRYSEGYGAIRITRELAERGLSLSDGKVKASQLYRTVRLRALVGEKVLNVDGQTYVLPGYYPPILSEAEFAALQLHLSGRPRQMGRGEIPGIVTGIGILYCGYCGKSLTSQNSYTRRKPDGTLNPGHRRVVCVGYLHGGGCTTDATFSVVPVENAVMDFCSDQLNLASLVSGPDPAEAALTRLAAARAEHNDVERQLERIAAALLESNDPPAIFVRRARELEEKLGQVQAKVRQAEIEIPVAGREQPSDVVDAWVNARDGAKALDYDDRMTVRQLVIGAYSKIVVFQRGIARRPKARFMDVVMTGRYGRVRVIRVNRRTGAWQASDDVTLTPSGTLPLPPNIADSSA